MGTLIRIMMNLMEIQSVKAKYFPLSPSPTVYISLSLLQVSFSLFFVQLSSVVVSPLSFLHFFFPEHFRKVSGNLSSDEIK